MNRLLLIVCLSVPSLMLADDHIGEGAFKINKKNCNLPMDEIRRLLPKQNDQNKAIKLCMAKSVKERWMQRRNVSKK